MRFATGCGLVMAALATCYAQPDTPMAMDNALAVYVVQMLQGSEPYVAGAGVYLGKGLVITASHVAGANHPKVRLDGQDVPARMIKGGSFDTIDLALFSIEEDQLPRSYRLLGLPLCASPAPPGAPVILAAPQGITRARIVDPSNVSPATLSRYPTMIDDVATPGKSGSGVFDAEKQCLLGILSAKITNTAQHREIGTYFVSASIIESFLPLGYGW